MGKKWCRSFACFFCFFMVTFGGLTIVIDPYFHYHKPLERFSYRIYNERYQNDGIVKHFDYNALITGTSMVQNFKTSEMDILFGTNAIKVPYEGAAYKEIRENLERAIKANSDLKIILWGLDYNRFFEDFNATKYDSYPTYLYDDNPFNDVKYFFNKVVLLNETVANVILYTNQDSHTTTFDEYKNWNSKCKFGKIAVLKNVKRPKKRKTEGLLPFNPENIDKNVLSLVQAHPDIEFYLFWPPYSIVQFDIYNQAGILDNILKHEQTALKMIIPFKNVHFFSFFDDYSLITNLENYKDDIHYHQDINSYILKCMADGKHQITMENYESYCQKNWDFYTNYDYDAIYK